MIRKSDVNPIWKKTIKGGAVNEIISQYEGCLPGDVTDPHSKLVEAAEEQEKQRQRKYKWYTKIPKCTLCPTEWPANQCDTCVTEGNTKNPCFWEVDGDVWITDVYGMSTSEVYIRTLGEYSTRGIVQGKISEENLKKLPMYPIRWDTKEVGHWACECCMIGIIEKS